MDEVESHTIFTSTDYAASVYGLDSRSIYANIYPEIIMIETVILDGF